MVSQRSVRRGKDETLDAGFSGRNQGVEEPRHIDVEVVSRVLDRLDHAGVGGEMDDVRVPCHSRTNGIRIADITFDQLVIPGTLPVFTATGRVVVE
jgi:hypothetical protein